MLRWAGLGCTWGAPFPRRRVRSPPGPAVWTRSEGQGEYPPARRRPPGHSPLAQGCRLYPPTRPAGGIVGATPRRRLLILECHILAGCEAVCNDCKPPIAGIGASLAPASLSPASPPPPPSSPAPSASAHLLGSPGWSRPEAAQGMWRHQCLPETWAPWLLPTSPVHQPLPMSLPVLHFRPTG